MKKDYLEELILDTDEELIRLQNQMNELLDDLQYSQDKQEKLQREMNKDTAIFSPRSRKSEMDQKFEKTREEVKVNNQKIEYIRERIEIATKKKEEYITLLQGIVPEKNKKENETDELKKSAEIKEFLRKIESKTEICIELLESNYDACKNELLKMIVEIKKYYELIEKREKGN